MNTVITINGNTNSMENFVTWVPSPAQVRLENPGEAADPVRVRLQNQTPGGRQLRFGTARSGPGQDTLELDLPVSGDPVPFFVAGKFDPNEIMIYDAMMEVVEAATGNPLSVTPVFVRVRRDADKLDPDYRETILSALSKLNVSGRYQVFRDVHVDSAYDEEHGNIGFLPWHRAYLLDLERELQKEEPRFALPYWRFDATAANLFTADFFGRTDINDDVVFSASNPLKHWAIDNVTVIDRRSRFVTANEPASGDMGPVITEDATIQKGEPGARFSRFTRMEGQPHGAAHRSFDGSIDTPETAVMDPLFFLLHSNVDRLWATWQFLKERFDPANPDSYLPPTAPVQRIGHNLNDTMWPWNEEDAPPRPGSAPGGDFPQTTIVAAPGLTPRVRDMIDYQGSIDPQNCLGFDYDLLPFNW